MSQPETCRVEPRLRPLDSSDGLRDEQRLRAVPIHRRPDLLGACADLLNSEWQRSRAARIHSLQKSCPEFPVSLVLLRGLKETERLLGHARLSRVVGQSRSLFVESVVVSRAERGKGYGRAVMREAELYASGRGFTRLCLTTHDQQHFYAHLGYVLSTPVQSAGAMIAFVPMETLLKFSRRPDSDGTTAITKAKDTQPHPSSPPPPPPPPAPPPPPPPLPPSSIACPPPPPLLPSTITHPLPQSSVRPQVQTLSETPYRDAKGAPIYWMHKDI